MANLFFPCFLDQFQYHSKYTDQNKNTGRKLWLDFIIQFTNTQYEFCDTNNTNLKKRYFVWFLLGMLFLLENKHMYLGHKNHDTNTHRILLIVLCFCSRPFLKNQFCQHRLPSIEHVFVV